MKLAITIYPDDFAEADRIIHQLRGVRGLELDGYMGKKTYERPFTEAEKNASREIGTGDSDEKADNDISEVSHPATRANVSPGEPAIGKIGSKAKDEILTSLDQGRQPIKAYAEHLKLLWKRGEVKFDGKEYFL